MAKKRFKVNEDYWTIKVVTSKQMAKEREDGKDIAGLYIADTKTILIEKDHVEQQVVLHELVHAYWSCLCLSDTSNLNIDDMEEICAEFIASKGEIMVKKAKKLVKDLHKMMEEE